MEITLKYQEENLTFEANIEKIHNGWMGSAGGHGVHVSAVTGHTKESVISNLKMALGQELKKRDGTFLK